MTSSPLPAYDVLLERLSTRLEGPLPGHDAHATMAPRSQVRKRALSVKGRTCRDAGVLVLLFPRDGEPTIVLTVRRDELSDHGGQISFPGGKREGDETLSETALRETWEEVGLVPSAVRLLGPLTPLYVPPSAFCVYPVLGATSETPSLRPTDREVEQVLDVSLRHLLDSDTRIVETWTLHGREIDVPYYDVGGHTVWGATAMMLAEVLAVIREATASI